MKRFKDLSIRTKVVLITGIVLIVTIGLNSFISGRVFVHEYTNALVLQASGIAQSLKLQLDRIMRLGIALDEIVGFERQCQNIVHDHDTIAYALVVDYGGTILFHNDIARHGQLSETFPPSPELQDDPPASVVQVVQEYGEEYYEIAVPVFGEHQEVAAWVKVGFPTRIIAKRTRDFWIQSGAAAFISVAVAVGLLVLALSKSVNAPLFKLLAVIKDIREKGTYSTRLVDIDSQDEVGQLAAAFDQMMLEIRKSHAKIHRYAQELEEKIQERTAALKTTNERLKQEIEERKRAEQQIKASLLEKEVLLKEIHHRVKNNMQVISSLLNLQSNLLPNERAQKMVQESQDRIKSMALIHEKLYQSENLTNIDFNDYVKTLAHSLYASYGPSNSNIQFTIDVEHVDFSIDTAIPCGLIINELISNALKYAFSGGAGTISIALKAHPESEYTLLISDDGVGLPADLDIETSETLGLQLVKGLAEEQLEGTLELQNTQGTTWSITFRKYQ